MSGSDYLVACAVIAVMAAGISTTSAEDYVLPNPGGQPGKFVVRSDRSEAPALRFSTLNGEERTSASLRGQFVLLNIWATWCSPCLKELPSLDRLQAQLGSKKFSVVALAQDRAGSVAVEPFLERLGIRNLEVFTDNSATSGALIGAYVLPTTILLDPEGREVGRVVGSADWSDSHVVNVLRHLMAESKGHESD